MQTPNAHTDSLHDELLARLNASEALAASGAFRVEEMLKRTDAEETQLVYLRLCDGRELGPYVRKLIDAGSGLGGAYPRLAEAQRAGARFRQLPRIVCCDERDGCLEVVMEHVTGATLREVVQRASTWPASADTAASSGGAEKAAAAAGLGDAELGADTGEGPEADAGTGPGANSAASARAGADQARLSATGRLALADRLMPSLCDAVLELHECPGGPIVHRDLTPANVIVPVADPTRPVLIDFGIARRWKDGARCDTTHFGTRAYAPPEQFGFGQTDVRSDVYALGMLAFFCLTGRDPEPSDRERGFAAPEVPGNWQETIRRATALDPQDRYGNVAELRAAITCAAPGTESAPGPEAAPGTEAADKASQASGAQKRAAKESAARRAGPPQVTALVASLLPIRVRTARAARAKKPARLLTAWNCLVIAATALCCAISVGLVFDERAMPSYPPVFRAFGYAVWMPCGLLLAGYLLLGKRWLRENVAFFRDRTPAKALKVLLLAYVGVTAVWLALSAF